jgi:hypothetical protein
MEARAEAMLISPWLDRRHGGSVSWRNATASDGLVCWTPVDVVFEDDLYTLCHHALLGLVVVKRTGNDQEANGDSLIEARSFVRDKTRGPD